MKEIIRTPESHFQNLPQYPFESNYLEVENGLHMHYVDQGNSNDPVILLLHGEPSWSFLYRKMIPMLSEQGFRVIAPDLIGFGKSDKFTATNDYSYENHLRWITQFIEKLDLNEIVLFCQDWGGLLGLRLITTLNDRFNMVIASNTFLPTGEFPMPESFMQWREFSQYSKEFDIGKILDMGTLQKLPKEVIQAYNAPFPSEKYKAGARIFPMLVPVELDDPEAINNRIAWKELLKWEKPFLTIWGDGDPIMKGADKIFQKYVPGAKGQEHSNLNAGHFIQEEKGEELAGLVLAFIIKNASQ